MEGHSASLTHFSTREAFMPRQGMAGLRRSRGPWDELHEKMLAPAAGHEGQ